VERKEYEAIATQWNDQITDLERWKWLRDNPGKLVVMLDNDSTLVRFAAEDDAPEDIILMNFESWVGNDDGIFYLLNAVEIRAEGV